MQIYVRLANNWVYSVYSYKGEHCRSVRNVLFVRRAGLFMLKSLSMNTEKLTIYVKISKYEHKPSRYEYEKYYEYLT